MPIASAAALRDWRLVVTVPGTDLQIRCRRPDPLELFAANLLPLETYAHVLDSLRTDRFFEDGKDDPLVYSEFVQRWVCAAAVEPRIVLTEEEAAEDPAALWVDEMEPAVRFEIFRATNDRIRARRVSDAVQTFREQRALRDRARPDSAPVSPAPVDALASA